MDNFNSILNEQLKQIKDAVKKRGRVNILIAGKTGVGKSTLINAIFQGDFATTGQGKPVTQNTRQIKKSGIPLRIYDTRGLELNRADESLRELESLIIKLGMAKDHNKHIHCAWFCISEDSRRVEDAEIKMLKVLAKYLPVLLVITKARADGGFSAKVKELLPEASNVIRVRAIPELQDDGHVLPPFNLPDLVEWTMRAIPDRHRNAFAAAQKVALRLKRERAHLIVVSATTAAAGIGAIPIPFADAYLLVPIQISMLAGISATFGLSISPAFLATLVSSTFSGVAGTLLGRSLVSNLMLLIPGAGVLLHGAISGATAATFTAAFGEAHIAAISLLMHENPNQLPTAKEVGDRVRKTLSGSNLFKKSDSDSKRKSRPGKVISAASIFSTPLDSKAA